MSGKYAFSQDEHCDPYENLAAAIVESAVEEYLRRLEYIVKSKNDGTLPKLQKIEEFFKSDWCATLGRGIDGDIIIDTLRKRVLSKHGYKTLEEVFEDKEESEES